MRKPTIHHFAVATLSGDVDRVNGVIKGVSVITGDVKAKGHNLAVDATTLEQMRSLGAAKGQVPVKWNHQSGADAVNGFLTNFRILKNKLKADWHLLKSHSQYEQAMELAERMPENVGLSASFSGLSELGDGTKVYNPDATTKIHYTIEDGARLPVPKGETIFARCEDLISVDLVATTAANPPGMFEVGVDSPLEDMADKIKPGASPETNQDLSAILLAEFRAFAAQTNQRFAALEADGEEDEEQEEEEELEEEQEEAPATGFQSIAQALHYFENRIDAAADASERKEFEAAQNALEFKVGELLDVNEQLLSENAMLAEAYQMLSAKTKTVVSFEAGTDGKAVPVARANSDKKVTAFEARVEQLKAGGNGKEAMSPADALCFAVEEDTERYQIHLKAKGTFVQTL